jgi:hypothetical protein
MKASPRSLILIAASVVLLAATAYIYVTYGSRAYFVAFHKPLHIGFADNKTVVQQTLPHFQVQSKFSSSSSAADATRTITVTLTSDKTVSGYVEVWILGQKNIASNGPTYTKLGVNNDTGGQKVIYQNDTSGQPTLFTKGKSETFSYTYTPPAPLPDGTYKVSDIVTSPSTFTDYYVNYNFAEFNVQ